MPAVAGGRAFVGSCAGKVLAIDWATGGIDWSYDVTEDAEQTGFHGDPLIRDGLLLVAVDNLLGRAGDGSLYAFDLDGDLVWHALEASGIPTDVVVDESRVYVTNVDDELICIERTTGKRLWRHTSGAGNPDYGPTSPPLVIDGIVYHFALDGTITGLDPADGSVSWMLDTGAEFSSEPVMFDAEVLIGDRRGRLLLLALGLDDPPIELQVDTNPMETPLVHEDGAAILLWHDQIMWLETDLTTRWTRLLEANWTVEEPVLWNEQIILGREDGVIEALDPASGKTLWTHPLEGQIRVISPIGDDLFVGTMEGVVMRVDGEHLSQAP